MTAAVPVSKKTFALCKHAIDGCFRISCLFTLLPLPLSMPENLAEMGEHRQTFGMTGHVI